MAKSEEYTVKRGEKKKVKIVGQSGAVFPRVPSNKINKTALCLWPATSLFYEDTTVKTRCNVKFHSSNLLDIEFYELKWNI